MAKKNLSKESKPKKNNVVPAPVVPDLIVESEKIIAHSNNLLTDMYSHRQEYSSKDIAWRCMDLTRAVLEVAERLVAVVKDQGKATVRKSKQSAAKPEIADVTEEDFKDL